jgi:hypothetical protein
MQAHPSPRISGPGVAAGERRCQSNILALCIQFQTGEFEVLANHPPTIPRSIVS